MPSSGRKAGGMPHGLRLIDLANSFRELEQLALSHFPWVQMMKQVRRRINFTATMKLSQENGPGRFSHHHCTHSNTVHTQVPYPPSEGSFSTPRVETPTDGNRLGSLMIIFATPHDGGVLSFRNRNYECHPTLAGKSQVPRMHRLSVMSCRPKISSTWH